jgi:hypothetical protein
MKDESYFILDDDSTAQMGREIDTTKLSAGILIMPIR